MKGKTIKVLAAVIMLTSLLIPRSATTENLMIESAERYIAAFKRGEQFHSPPDDLISDGRPATQAVERLRLELLEAGGEVREAVVDLLADLAIQTDPVFEQGVATIREPTIIAILAGEGCARHDQGCLAAMDALRTSSPVQLLAPHTARFAQLLEVSPTESALLLVAKAAAVEAKPVLMVLETAPEWADDEALAVAKAALGDEGEEAKLAKAIEAAKTGEELADALPPAGLAGTPKLLRLISSKMRTPLTIDRPGINETSLRLNVMDALRYNFPQVPAFYRNNVHDDEDYLRIENLLEDHFDLQFTVPRPPFLKVRGYPFPME